MTTLPAIPNPVTNSTERARDSLKTRRQKKLLKQSDDNGKDQTIQNYLRNDNNVTEWKSEQQQEVYRSKLLKALRRLQQSSGSGSDVSTDTRTGTAVRETADRVLAVTAKGRTRWSRAILTNKIKLRLMNSNRKQRGLVMTSTGNSRLRKPKVQILKLKKLMNKKKKLLVVKKKNLPDMQRRARVLGGLVPGCQKQSLPVVLKEATDYIPALEMQVKAMAALVELLSCGSGSGTGSVARAGNLDRLGLSRPSPCL